MVVDSTERGSEQALRESEAAFRAIFELAGVGKALADAATGRFLQVNRKQCEITGYPAEELLALTFADVTHPDDRARHQALYQEMLRGEVPEESIEKRYLRKDGTIVWVQVTATVVRDEHGRPLQSVAVIQDISERKRTEEALRASEERFRQLADNLPDGFIYQITVTPDGSPRFSYVSAGIEALLGVTATEVAASPGAMYGQIHEADFLRMRAREEESFRQRKLFDCQFRVRVRDGAVRWLHCRSAPRSFPDGWSVWDGIAVDITARKEAEEALRESEERLRLALDAGKIGAWDWDIQANKVTWSKRIYEFHGLPPGSFGGRVEDFAALVHPEDGARVSESIRQAVEEKAPYSAEFRIVRPNGEVRWIATNGRVLYDEAGQSVRMLGATMDVTERRVAEEALKEADRRKDEFLAMLAHELRGPLGPIRNSVQVLHLLGPPGPGLMEACAMIARQVEHMARLVDDLMEVSRITRGKVLLRKEQLDLVPLLHAAARDHQGFLDGAGVKLVVDLPNQPLWVSGDPTRLVQVLGNLLQNAAKFTDPGGEVLVHLVHRSEEGCALLRVRDTGIGMGPDILARLFEPFSQADRSIDRSRGGLGLGLALVKGLVELHDGSIQASSAGPGKGSEFTIRLPLSAEQNGPVKGTEMAASTTRSLSVLVIEDNRDAAESLRMLLELCGHRVAVAHIGAVGLETARAFRPDVVLCDIGLPGGIDGYAVAQALRSRSDHAETTLIALSGYGLEEDQLKARQAGFDRHLTKPVDPAALTEGSSGTLPLRPSP